MHWLPSKKIHHASCIVFILYIPFWIKLLSFIWATHMSGLSCSPILLPIKQHLCGINVLALTAMDLMLAITVIWTPLMGKHTLLGLHSAYCSIQGWDKIRTYVIKKTNMKNDQSYLQCLFMKQYQMGMAEVKLSLLPNVGTKTVANLRLQTLFSLVTLLCV